MRHPWLDGRFRPLGSLSDTLRIWTFLAGHTASGDLEAVALDWSCLPRAAHEGGIEAILQTHLFAGFPRVLNALATVSEHGVSENAKGSRENDEQRWLERGESNCQTVYGSAYEKLRSRVRTLHPDLDRWMVEVGYGRVLGRAGLSLRERELCVIAVLAGQNVPSQLRSHLRGAMHAGATADECGAILEQTTAIWDATAQEQADAVWAQMCAAKAQ